MEFNEKLQQLRKQKGMTQQELAEKLFVSRTAISKWESGRGYPNLDSLKAIASFFAVQIDELISSNQVLTIAAENQKQEKGHFRDLVFGLLDVCTVLLFFLPLFAEKGDYFIRATSLLTLDGVAFYLRIAYFIVVSLSVITGVLTLALQNCTALLWTKFKTKASLMLGMIAVLLFVISQQPYAAVFALSLLIIKAIMLIKRR